LYVGEFYYKLATCSNFGQNPTAIPDTLHETTDAFLLSLRAWLVKNVPKNIEDLICEII